MLNLVFGQDDILIGLIWIVSDSKCVHMESQFLE